MDHLCYLCLVFVMLSRLFIAALWSHAGTWLSFVMFNCVFVTFPCGILGQVWCLVVSIPDLCLISYFSRICNRTLQSEMPQPSPRNSVESDHGCTSRILFDYAVDNVRLTL